MASFAVGDYKLSGLMLGYGLITSEDIDEGLRRLKTSFEPDSPLLCHRTRHDETFRHSDRA